MFKQIVTLFRGVIVETGEEFTDRHALPLLKQQIRDCALAVSASRRAVAIAIAQNEQEVIQQQRLINQIKDLEHRTIEALEHGKNDLAREAAESIALLEAERETSAEALARFTTEINRLKGIVRIAEIKLKDLQRGQRLATATHQTQKLREAHPDSGLSALRDAEETLNRLQIRQRQIDVTEAAIADMEQFGDPSSIIEKLADAGCGDPLKASADDVLNRLKKQAKKKTDD